MPVQLARSAPAFPFRPATQDDAPLLAELINYAGEGLALHLWERMAGPGETAWDVGFRRTAREEGSSSYRNAVVAVDDGRAVACLIGYEIPDLPEPIGDDMPPMFRPLQELENQAPGSWYVNVLAVLPAFRNVGLGSALLALAEETGRERGKRSMSIIASDANAGARRLYERKGYRERASRPMVKEDWRSNGKNWVLLTKPL